MSKKKIATRRLSLLAGSSLIAAGLTAFGGLALTPATALAQVTCASPAVALGNGTTAVTIAAGTYNPGITCSYAGTGSSVTTTGSISVSTTAGGDGVNLSATGASAINWISSAGIVTAGAQTNGPLIDATSVSGAINITTGGISANAASVTNGISAVSTGGGAITITRVTGAVSNTAALGQAAIQAVTNGGNIVVNTGTGTTSGRLRGIVAQTSGTGSVALTVTGSVAASNIDGIAAIQATAGSGGLNIAISGNNSPVRGGTPGKAIIGVSAGNAVITNGSVIGAETGGGTVDLSGVVGAVTFTNPGSSANLGRWIATGASAFGAGNDTLTMSGVGENVMVGGSSLDLGAGNDTFNMSAFLTMGLFTGVASLDFGPGTDQLNMSGVFSTNGGTLSNLEAFNNSGVIYLGTAATVKIGNNPQDVIWTRSDGVADDRLSMPGATFTGSDGSRVVMDVLLGADTQVGCDSLTVADCLNLPNGSTAGETTLTINYIGADPALGVYNPTGVTIVDVGGSGTSAAGHFVLDPASENYVLDPVSGAMISRPGLFGYALRYDPATQRHALVGLPRSPVLEYAVLSGAAQSIWYMTSDAVIDRQMDMRKATDGGSVWLRTAGEYTQREIGTDLEVFGDTLTVDNSYKLYAGTVMGGMDLITGTSGEYDYVLGAQIGYVASSFDLDASETSGRFSGATGGVYGSAWSNRLFLDGTFNMNGLALDYESPGLGSKTNTFVNSIGARLDGGMRWMLGARTFVEPLATLAFARTSFEEISLSGGEVQPETANSRRGALGVRLGADLTEGPINIGYFVAGRAWNEFAGQAHGVVHNPGEDLLFTDEFTGGFGEAEAGLNLFNEAGTLSGFLSSGVKFKNGYDAVNLSLGLNMRW